jgi:4-hydroxy-tetrahydrodipicolinate synthase
MPTSQLRDDRFAGAFTAIVTPFTEDGLGIDTGRLEAQIARQAEAGIAGIVVASVTGESPTLNEAEYRTLVRSAVEMGKAHDLVVVAGTGSNCTAHAVELQRIAMSLGADAGLSVTPHYNKPTQEGLYAHFATIAESVELPVMLGNDPDRTGLGFEPATVERLYESPWLVSIVDATGGVGLASDVLARCPGIALLSGDDGSTLPLMAIGGVGCVSVVSNVAPRRVAALCQAMLDGDLATAGDRHAEMFLLARVMTLETNPICVKAAMAMMHLDTGQLRLPMTQPTEDTRRAIQQALARASLLEAAAC